MLDLTSEYYTGALMSKKPAYFEAVRQDAAKAWDDVKNIKLAAGSLHLLFEQVRRPQHVLSELLQNADDAGATEAVIDIKGDVFTFEHNGKDFTAEDFESLCGFGYSNKRMLHTIGFRGIGFKSTFGLGNIVEIYTPTLSVRFNHKRFTEPEWIASSSYTDEKTHIQVANIEQHRLKELEKNLKEWSSNPASLLFFQNLRSIRIENQKIQWRHLRRGPLPESEWWTHGKTIVLLVRSEPKDFPDDVLEDIRKVRGIDNLKKTEFPPCRVEVLFGMNEGHIYAILPAGSGTGLPFACNAPFIQPPDRSEIKPPEESPTNRWLLKRIGKLAARAMHAWLEQDMPLDERAGAYGLLPGNTPGSNSTASKCGDCIREAFRTTTDGSNMLLVEDGSLVSDCIMVPREILESWTPKQASMLLDKGRRPILYHKIKLDNQKKLLDSYAVDEIDRDKILQILSENKPPKPSIPDGLRALWAYVGSDATHLLNIVPVQCEKTLHAANEVIQIDEKPPCSGDDWEFLSEHLRVMDKDWQLFLKEHSRSILPIATTPRNDTGKAYAVLKILDLANPIIDINEIMGKAAARLSQNNAGLSDWVQFAQIAAKSGTRVDNILFVTQNQERKQANEETILFDDDGGLESLLPADQRPLRLLHRDYSTFTACSREEWLRWIKSGHAGIRTFSPVVKSDVKVSGKDKIEEKAKERGIHAEFSYPFKIEQFIWTDHDFDEAHWNHWKRLAANDEQVWFKIVKRILDSPTSYKNRIEIRQATTRRTERIPLKSIIPPAWAMQLQEYRCLPDTQGALHKPNELRTRATENLVDGELFVDKDLDNENTRPLLELLGVRKAPIDPNSCLNLLRKLTGSKEPPIREIEEIYKILDQMLDTVDAKQHIVRAFHQENLVLDKDRRWRTASAELYIHPDESYPGALTIHHSISDLKMWGKMGMVDKPTADLAIKWIKSLQPNPLSAEVRRIKKLLKKYPTRIWKECGHWLNLDEEWTPVKNLKYALTMHPLVPYQHLYSEIRRATADLRQLPSDISIGLPFSRLPLLATKIEDRLDRNQDTVGNPVEKEWLRVIGAGLQRLKLKSAGGEGEERIRSLAKRLTMSKWHEVETPRAVPYVDGRKAGEGRPVDVIWESDTIYVRRLPMPRLASRVPQEIGKIFNRRDVQDALHYGFERRPQDIRLYLEKNFTLSEDVAESRMNSHAGAGHVSNAAGDSHVVPAGSGTEPIPAKRPPPPSQPGAGRSSNGESATERKLIELEGMKLVMEYERQRKPGRKIRDVSGDKCGYDIKSPDRRIEVKSFRKTGCPSLTKNEWTYAKNHGSECWLYVVENVFDEVQPEEKITTIQDPYRKLRDEVEPVTTVAYKIRNWSDVRSAARQH